ncbi:hypothetical protein QVD17_22300 [Tagetes erecta]|uniref:Tetraspanin n=1 Tax=Tagetes erecta TaxID=13708 RepID=A0AAD8NTH1_TARER|nr:hypothetical protein QVD17_22300 [Tagetes erecta]
MRTNFFHSSLANILKFLNFFQLFVGLLIILYSTYMLNQWHKHLPDSPDAASTVFNTAWVPDRFIRLKFVDGMINDSASPWFIYAFMGLGVMLCCISCTGHIAAEAINGRCLRCYTVLKTVFIVLEVALVSFIAIDRHWERDLPLDPTGEIDKFREFVESDTEFCKWVGITVVIVQAVCLLLAEVLRAMVKSEMKRDEVDIEEDGVVQGIPWEPLLNPHVPQTSVSVNVNGKPFYSNICCPRTREKYGLSGTYVK